MSSPPNKHVLSEVKNQFRKRMKENGSHSTISTSESAEEDFILDMVVEVICVLHYRMGNKIVCVVIICAVKCRFLDAEESHD